MKKRAKFKRYQLKKHVALCLSLFLVVFLIPMFVVADNVTTLEETIIYPVVKVSIATTLIKETPQENLENWRRSLTSSEQVALYDCYGGDIDPYIYTGEKQINVTIADRLIDWYSNGSEFSIDAFKELFFGSNSVSRSDPEVYVGRPTVFNDSDIDPRYEATRHSYSSLEFDTIDLNLRKGAVNVLSYLNGPLTILSDTIGYFNDLVEELPDVVVLIQVIIIVGALIFAAFLFLKGHGHVPLKEIAKLCVSVLIIEAFTVGIFVLEPFYTKFNERLSYYQSDFLSETLGDPENYVTYNSENFLEASLWDRIVFNKWCNLEFGCDWRDMNDYVVSDATVEQCSPEGAGLQTKVGGGVTTNNLAIYSWGLQTTAREDISKCPNNDDIYIDFLRMEDTYLDCHEKYLGGRRTYVIEPSEYGYRYKYYESKPTYTWLPTLVLFLFGFRNFMTLFMALFFVAKFVIDFINGMFSLDKDRTLSAGSDILKKFLSYFVLIALNYMINLVALTLFITFCSDTLLNNLALSMVLFGLWLFGPNSFYVESKQNWGVNLSKKIGNKLSETKQKLKRSFANEKHKTAH